MSLIKLAFYGACNSILSHGSGIDEVALLHLQESYTCSLTFQFLLILQYTGMVQGLRRDASRECNHGPFFPSPGFRD